MPVCGYHSPPMKPRSDPSDDIAFCPCKDLVMSLGPQITAGAIGLTCSLAPPPTRHQSAPSSSPPGLARWCVGLLPWAGGGGMRGGELGVGGGDAVSFGGTGLGVEHWFAVVGAGWLRWERIAKMGKLRSGAERMCFSARTGVKAIRTEQP